VQVSEGFLSSLFKAIGEDANTKVTVSLPDQSITIDATGESENFEINGYKKNCMTNGYDDIDFLLSNSDKIKTWEKTSFY